jgi:DNA-binding NarL/FixJ family response regulator
MLLSEEPAWERLLIEVEAFLREPVSKPQASAPKERFSVLSPRERDVLEAIARGLDNGEIAARLRLSEKTVRNHITRVLDKIGVEHRYQAIVLARDAGLGRAPPGAR